MYHDEFSQSPFAEYLLGPLSFKVYLNAQCVKKIKCCASGMIKTRGTYYVFYRLAYNLVVDLSIDSAIVCLPLQEFFSFWNQV